MRKGASALARDIWFGTGIKTKIILLALLCAVLPCALISVVVYASARNALENAVRVELSGVAQEQMARLMESLARADTNLSTWSTLQSMQNVLIDDLDGIIQEDLVGLQKRYAVFGNLLVINPQGLVVAASQAENKGKYFAAENYFQSASKGVPFKSAVRWHDLVGERGMAIAAPIRAEYDPETVIGVLAGIVDWERMQAELRAVKVWGAGQDDNHRLTLRDKKDRILYQSSDLDGDADTGLPTDAGAEVVKLGDKSFLVGTETAAAPDGGKRHPWVLNAMVSTDVAYAPMVVLRNRIALMTILIIGAALALGAFASARLIVNPIRWVTEAMTRVSAGDADFTLEKNEQRDEIGQMLHAISIFREQMLRDNNALQDSERQLRTQNVRFDAALGNMSHGLSMFDRDGKLVVCNRRFAELYRLPSELIGPGTTERQLVEHGVEAGLYDVSAAAKFVDFGAADHSRGRVNDIRELENGRTIAVSTEPMSGGGWISTHEDITDRRQAEERISHMARHDALTNLPNRVTFRHEIEGALTRVSHGELVAVLCLDLDYFKSVNDTLGHPVGDALLCRVADRLRGCLREGDTVARLGGDEFALIQVGADQPNSATALTERVIETLSAPYEIDGHQIVIGASVGISIAPNDGEDPDLLLKSADMALYRAKGEGRGTYRFFEPEMDARMQARRRLELDLRKALKQTEFELYYQPLVDMESNGITGFEALVRWHHPERGMVPPGDFIPLAEEIGLIIPLGEWIIGQACADAAKWPSHVRVAVNLSPAQFKNRDLALTVFNALARAQLAADRLELEITETVLLQDSEATLAILHQLRAMGVRISMDDFGTGYSSLSYLRSFPFDKIKIDQSFIRDLATRADSAVIVRAVTTIGNSLGISTTAEGVENADQMQRLKEEGCTEVQGFFLGRPLPVADAIALLQENAAAEAGEKLRKIAS